MFHQYLLFLKHPLFIDVTKNCTPVELGIMKHCRLLQKKLFTVYCLCMDLCLKCLKKMATRSHVCQMTLLSAIRRVHKILKQPNVNKNIVKNFFEELHQVKLVSFFLTSRSLGFIFIL